MPIRPPKSWFRRCKKQVEEKGGAIDSDKVCGKVWSRKSDKEKRRTIRKEEKRKKK